MSSKRVTLRLLSERSGFDVSTISRVLRGDRTLSIRPENSEAIRRLATELGYVPNAAGRSLRSSRTFSLGAVIPSLQNQIHAQIVEGAYEVCMEAGYSLIVVQATQPDRQIDSLRQLVEKNGVEGILALTFRNELAKLQDMHQIDAPVASVNWKAEGIKNAVLFDDFRGGVLATRHLLDLGHRRIAHLSGDLVRFNAQERFAGYRRALDEAGIEFDPTLVSLSGYSFEDGFAAMERLLTHYRGKFSAVFAVSLLTAAGAISALRKHKIAVPEEISIVGFHDGLLGRVITPSLSTVSFPLVEMGRIAARGMIDLLEGRVDHFWTVVPGGTIVARESTMATSEGNPP
jgi:DNA-binding LacI/PurR family transcriptional regulator